jgi:hypothetical protein
MILGSSSPIGAWLWEHYGNYVTQQAASALRSRWEKFKWREAADDYRDKVKKLYGSMQIIGMPAPVLLDDIFADVYVLDKPTAFSRHTIERLKLNPDPTKPPDAERISPLGLLRENLNLFLLGKPGAGKTTFLKYVAIQAADQNINGVPIFVSLKQWSDSGKELMSFIEERFEVCNFPAAKSFVEWLLQTGRAIVLFDGLDEVNHETGDQERRLSVITSFVEKYDRSKYLITCRTASTDYSLRPFTYVEIADFTDGQIRQFVRNWFRDNEGERDEKSSQIFLDEFESFDNKGLHDLARTPLLLTLICIAYGETFSLPKRRVDIYEDALDALLKKWDSTRGIKRAEIYRTLSRGHKQNMFASIAAATFQKADYFIRQNELEQLIVDYIRNIPPHEPVEAIDAEAILKAIEEQHGILVLRTHKIYSFSHLTFQEYYTARSIITNFDSGALDQLVQHSTEARWREVFLVATSLIPDGTRMIKTLKHKVDTLIRDDCLRRLLEWNDQESKGIMCERSVARQGHLFRALYYSIPNRDLERALMLERPHARAFDEARGISELPKSKWRTRARDFLPSKSGPDSLTKDRVCELTSEQQSELTNYLNATRLLRDCVALATMLPEEKELILEGLFLPPPIF